MPGTIHNQKVSYYYTLSLLDDKTEAKMSGRQFFQCHRASQVVELWLVVTLGEERSWLKSLDNK